MVGAPERVAVGEAPGRCRDLVEGLPAVALEHLDEQRHAVGGIGSAADPSAPGDGAVVVGELRPDG